MPKRVATIHNGSKFYELIYDKTLLLITSIKEDKDRIKKKNRGKGMGTDPCTGGNQKTKRVRGNGSGILVNVVLNVLDNIGRIRPGSEDFADAGCF